MVQFNCEQNEAMNKPLCEIAHNKSNFHEEDFLRAVQRNARARAMYRATQSKDAADNASRGMSEIGSAIRALRSTPPEIPNGSGRQFKFTVEEVKSPAFIVLVLRWLADYVHGHNDSSNGVQWWVDDDGPYDPSGARATTLLADEGVTSGADLYSVGLMSPRTMSELLALRSYAAVRKSDIAVPGWESMAKMLDWARELRLGYSQRGQGWYAGPLRKFLQAVGGVPEQAAG